jgi:hypothetical protein
MCTDRDLLDLWDAAHSDGLGYLIGDQHETPLSAARHHLMTDIRPLNFAGAISAVNTLGDLIIIRNIGAGPLAIIISYGVRCR